MDFADALEFLRKTSVKKGVPSRKESVCRGSGGWEQHGGLEGTVSDSVCQGQGA